jgi:two-component system, NarL family, nitrate/nitrite response regulator NarL
MAFLNAGGQQNRSTGVQIVRRSVPTVIVEPRTLLREGLASLLQDSNFKVIACVATIDELSGVLRARVGLLILGVSSGAADDLQVLGTISAAARRYKVVAVADQGSQPAQIDVLKILRSGVDGYIQNVKSRDVLLKSLELAFLEQKLVILGDQCEMAEQLENRAPVPSPDDTPARANGTDAARPALSGREMEVLGRLASGESNKVIARNCSISESTVKIHLKSILRKIHVQNRTQAAIWAIRNNQVRLRVSPPVAPIELTPPSLPELLALENFRPRELG